MMMVLLDEPTLILFESPDQPPDALEAVDVLNDLYSFCDENGQRYVGVITRPTGGWFRRPEYGYGLQPEGAPDITNALELAERAVMIEPNTWFEDLESLRCYLEERRSAGTLQLWL
jgi:hypothetical protein